MDNQPQIDFVESWYYSFFHSLARHRTGSMGGINPISLHDILTMCELHGVDDQDEIHDVIEVIGRLDNHVIELLIPPKDS